MEEEEDAEGKGWGEGVSPPALQIKFSYIAGVECVIFLLSEEALCYNAGAESRKKNSPVFLISVI